jgi:predicted DNA-binding protein with PD1-like motif
MESKERNNIIILRLFTDENLHDKIKEVCRIYRVKTAIILSGIGQLKSFKLGYYNKEINYVSEKFEKPYELLSLTGNICHYKGNYEAHMHSVLGSEKKDTVGGHLLEGIVETTNEIVLLKTDIDIIRRFEGNTGLKGMFLE